MKKNLYAVKQVIDGVEYTFKLGNRELLEAEENGVDVTKMRQERNLKNMFVLAHISIQTEEKMTFDEFVDFIDNSDLSNPEFSGLVQNIIDKGLMKGKKQQIKNAKSNTIKKI